MNRLRKASLIGITVVACLVASAIGAQEVQISQEELIERLLRQDERIRQLEERIQELEGEVLKEKAIGARSDSASVTPMTSAAAAIEGAQMTAQVATEGDASSPDGTDDSLTEYEENLPGDLRETHRLMTREELASDDFPASWPMFGTDLRMKIGGYIKTDFIADFDGTLDSTQFLMRTIPVEGTPEYGGDAYVDFFAKESRFNLDIRQLTGGSLPIRGFIEGDFFSQGNNFRLRHAYFSAGDFLIGQTWTTLSFLEAMPYMIDFAAGDALFGGRAAQFRYGKSLNDNWKVSFALEDLQFLGIQNANGLPGRATTQLPLAAFRSDYHYGKDVFLLGASIGQLHWDGGSNGTSDSAMQVAVVAAGRHYLSDRAYGTWHFAYSEGAGENIMAFAGTDANAVLDAEGNLDTFPAFSTVLGFGYDWTPTLSSNFSYAYGWLDTPDTRDPLALKRGGIGHLNLVWKPTKKFSTGVEFMWGKTRVQNDATGDATRLQMMGKFEF